jgi:hypothetical protein
MKHRYIVCIDNSTPEQEKAFIAFLEEKGMGWWHHLKNTWLLYKTTNSPNELILIRDSVVRIFKNANNMVFYLAKGEGTWAGFGPSGEDRNMFKWINENF